MEVKRICIYPKDVERITGKSGRSGRRIMAQIRRHYQKQSDQFITIDEFSHYTGIHPDHIKRYLTD